ncbi:MAG: PAS domain S-box protein [Armatimonadota bacterium]
MTRAARDGPGAQAPAYGQGNGGECPRAAPPEPQLDYSHFSLDRDGRFRSASDTLLALAVGYNVSELLGQHYSTLLAEGEAERVEPWFEQVLAGGTVGPVEVEVVRKDGERIWVRLTAMPQVEAGEVVGVDCVAQDATEEVRARVEVPRLRQLHESIVDSISAGIVVVDAQHAIVGWNRHMENWFQMGREEALGRPAIDLFPKLAEEGLAAWLSVALEGGDPFSLARWRHESERRSATFYVDISVVSLRAADSDVIGALLLFEDVSHEVALEDELRRSEQLATIAQTAAAVNHEVNNPLATVLGNAELLMRHCTDDSPTTVKRLKRIAEAASRIAEVTQKLAHVTDPVITEWAPGRTMLDIDRSAAPEE